MFKKLKLTYHLLILYGFLGVFMLSLCGYGLFVIRDYESTIATVDREQLPLARTVAEISRHQLDQTLRFNEILLYARISDREKYEISNERYVQAGKRMGDEILEGRNIAQRGIERADSESRLKELDTIKTLLKGIEKAHGDYEHLGALLIRGIYQYDFLLKNEFLTSGDHIAGEEEATKHITFMKTTLSALEDETRRLESGIKESMERVKQLSQTLAVDAKQQKERVYNRILPLLFFSLSGGLLLVFVTAKVYKDVEYIKSQLCGQSLAVLADVLTQFQNTFEVLGPSSKQLEKNFFLQDESFRSTTDNCREMARLSENNQQLAVNLHYLVAEKNDALEKTDALVNQLNDDAGDMLESGTETRRTVLSLKEIIAQISMLATNASAEAFRSDATRSFAIFTEEIRDLARSTVVVSDAISHRIDDAMKGIEADRLHVSQTQKSFLEVTELAKKEVLLFEKTSAAIQRQSALLKAVQGETMGAKEVLQANEKLLQQIKNIRDNVQSRVNIANENLERLEKGEMPLVPLEVAVVVDKKEVVVEDDRDD